MGSQHYLYLFRGQSAKLNCPYWRKKWGWKSPGNEDLYATMSVGLEFVGSAMYVLAGDKFHGKRHVSASATNRLPVMINEVAVTAMGFAAQPL